MTEEFRAEELLFLTRKINLSLMAQLELNLRSGDMSGIQIYFLVYILRHHPDGTYLTDMCREVGGSKATLSAMIKKMREKGYLCFQENPKDIRKKKVLPTEKLLAEKETLVGKASKMENGLFRMLTARERTQLKDLEQKVLSQLAGPEQKETETDRRVFYGEKSVTRAETV